MNRYTMPPMIHNRQFARCRHGFTIAHNCWRCGIWHPLTFPREFRNVRALKNVGAGMLPGMTTPTHKWVTL